MVEQAVGLVVRGGRQVGAVARVAPGAVVLLPVAAGMRTAESLDPAGGNVDQRHGGHAHRGFLVHLPCKIGEQLVACEAEPFAARLVARVARARFLHDALRLRIDGEVHVEARVDLVLHARELVGTMGSGDGFASGSNCGLFAFAWRLRIRAEQVFPRQADVVQVREDHVQRFGRRLCRLAALRGCGGAQKDAGHAFLFDVPGAHREARGAVALPLVGHVEEPGAGTVVDAARHAAPGIPLLEHAPRHLDGLVGREVRRGHTPGGQLAPREEAEQAAVARRKLARRALRIAAGDALRADAFGPAREIDHITLVEQALAVPAPVAAHGFELRIDGPELAGDFLRGACARAGIRATADGRF